MPKITLKTKYKQYQVETPMFDSYNKDTAIQDALGSRRSTQRQEASSLRSTNYKEGESGWKITPSEIFNVPLISTGIAAPTTTPIKVGNMFIDTVAGKVYIATGITNSADWKILN